MTRPPPRRRRPRRRPRRVHPPLHGREARRRRRRAPVQQVVHLIRHDEEAVRARQLHEAAPRLQRQRGAARVAVRRHDVHQPGRRVIESHRSNQNRSMTYIQG